MYVAQVTHVAVSLIWLGDEEEGADMRLTVTPPNGDSCDGVPTHERMAFVDHPPPRHPKPEPDPDPLDPAFISAVRWNKRRLH